MQQFNFWCSIMCLSMQIFNFQLTCFDLPPPFDPLFDPRGLENGICIENCSGYNIILKIIPYVYQKRWETNLSKIIQKILVLDLSMFETGLNLAYVVVRPRSQVAAFFPGPLLFKSSILSEKRFFHIGNSVHEEV